METEKNGNAKLTAEKLVQRLSSDDIQVSVEEARELLSFLKTLAKLAVNLYLCEEDGKGYP